MPSRPSIGLSLAMAWPPIAELYDRRPRKACAALGSASGEHMSGTAQLQHG